MKLRLRLAPLLLALAAAFLLAGCVNVAGGSLGVSLLVFLVALMGLGAAACSDDTSEGRDTGWQVGEDTGSDADDADDATDTQDGRWESCCENGRVDSCFCPAGMACNYGMYTDCGDGTCSYDPQGCYDTGDAGDVSDTTDTTDTTDTSDTSDTTDTADTSDVTDEPDGTWEPCCQDGQVDTCFCPAGVACNYGWYTDCGDGTCVMGGGGQDECKVDAGM
ncbi:hypothetical protein FIV42_08680 [Persicimonas caeni]|uniref:EGF-like domain-containing protein n=1 Tax=Persicimonas caeni TaxID=2292766 RepID=A0A4Y6PR41_PERCE|nr:hypothetical protein [Persicimonas caeni]QDG50802.1 hypothetical protein FIV42_08680 [Persicimonas caeni]QED32023.1 hypothetical protein FRD00_08675 [Persicimonas caeni]